MCSGRNSVRRSPQSVVAIGQRAAERLVISGARKPARDLHSVRLVGRDRRFIGSSSLRAALLAVVIGGGLSVRFAGQAEVAHDNWVYQEVTCEEALAYLMTCCPGLDPGEVDCRYYRDVQELSGCEECEVGANPDISVDESEVYRELSCERVRAEGVCEQVAAADRRWNECDEYWY